MPIITMKIIPSKYANPIRVAAFFDTGASYSIMNPDILPPSKWKKKKQFFHAANGEIFCTELISKPIKLEFFPGCSLIHKIIGSKLPGKDLIIGFDLYMKKPGLKILPKETMASFSSSNLVAIFPPTFPKDAEKITLSDNPPQEAIIRAQKIHQTLIRIYGQPMVHDFTFHPQYPFANLFPIRNTWYMPKAVLLLFWYLTSFLTIAIEVQTVPLSTTIKNFRNRPELRDPYKTQMDLLSWFAPLSIWQQYLSREWERFQRRHQKKIQSHEDALNNCYTIFLISLNCTKVGENQTGFAPTIEVYGTNEWPLSPKDNPQIRMLEKQLFLKNRVIPDEIWPGPEEDAPWDRLLTEYTKKIKRILDELNSPQSSPSSDNGPITDLADEGPSISEGLSLEEEQLLYQRYDPYEYSQKPWEDSINSQTENLVRLGISVSTPEVTQSCQMHYNLTPPETHSISRPDTQLLWFTDEDWEDPQFRAEILRIIDEQEAIQIEEQIIKAEEERMKKNPRRKSKYLIDYINQSEIRK
ncbi:hypothetical protein TIFTF001_031649 [Ficus carica]|uniref:Peptidase A2 domain-containing protein n=1 Tax=Ficus carica TaxID=3494 RepID=A0AA88DWX1_FICCA|nr:hypothetical protein TIFTF001_031649 [Ficus carica]